MWTHYSSGPEGARLRTEASAAARRDRAFVYIFVFEGIASFTICSAMLLGIFLDTGVTRLVLWGLALTLMAVRIPVSIWLGSSMQLKKLEAIMLERGVRPDLCFRCGYDLKHTHGHQCPECGRAVAAGEQREVSAHGR